MGCIINALCNNNFIQSLYNTINSLVCGLRITTGKDRRSNQSWLTWSRDKRHFPPNLAAPCQLRQYSANYRVQTICGSQTSQVRNCEIFHDVKNFTYRYPLEGLGGRGCGFGYWYGLSSFFSVKSQFQVSIDSDGWGRGGVLAGRGTVVNLNIWGLPS